jgi:SlyX protein
MPDSAEGARLDDLEVRLTFVDDAVSELAGADAELSQRLMKLEAAVQAIRQELINLRADSGHDPHSEPPPPHY